jgi:Secretion system C-terminal sorting domain
MKYLFVLFFLFDTVISYAQPYFIDTLSTLPDLATPIMGNVFELPNNQGYAVSNFANYNMNLIYTDINGHRTGQKSWRTTDTLNSSHSIRSSTKLTNGQHLIVTQERGACITCDYGGMYCFSNDLQDTLWTRKFRYAYQGQAYPIFLDFVKEAADHSIWTTGLMSFNANIISHITHISANGNIIGQNHFTLTTGLNFVQNILPTPDGGCLISMVEAQNNLGNTYQVAFVKVNALGQQEWYKQYGTIGKRDHYSFAFRAANPNEYWLVYTEGTTTSSTVIFGRIKGIRVNSAGIALETKYLCPYARLNTDTYDAYQDANDGSVTFALTCNITGENPGHLWKFSSNMDSIWRKPLPLPNYNNNAYESTRAYHLTKTANGDYLCGGRYFANLALINETIFLSRLDTMGCLVVGTEESPSPSRVGEDIRIYPNPASNEIILQYPDFQNKQIIITDILGRTQKAASPSPSQGGETQTINIQNLPNGIYYLSIHENSRLLGSRKFVVLHE